MAQSAARSLPRRAKQAPDAPAGSPDVDTGVEFVVDEDAELDPPHDVLVHNDDVTPFDFVAGVLQHIFDLSAADAYRVTLTAHLRGQAYVATLPLEDAKYRVYRAHQMARSRGYPLTFSIRPAR